MTSFATLREDYLIIEVEYDYTPAIKGITNRPPEFCEPPEPASFDVVSYEVLDNPFGEYITLDIVQHWLNSEMRETGEL